MSTSAKPVVHSEKKSVIPVIFVACVGVILSFFAFFQFGDKEASQKRADFHRLADDQSHAIDSEITATMALLRSLRGLFTISETIGRTEFRSFVRSLETGSSVQALEWIPRVPHEKREEYERRARDEGLLEFRFAERQSQGVMVPAGRRQEYFPVYFVEPFEGNEAAIGFDLGSNPARLEALRKSRDTGEMIASSRITLVQEKDDQYGFLVFVPVFDEVAGGSAADRHTALTGFGLGVYRIGDLIESALPMREKSTIDTKVFVFDQSASRSERLLYPKGAELEAGLALEDPLGFTRQIDVAGRTWSLLMVPAIGSAFSSASWQPGLILAAGLLFTILLAMYMDMIRRRSVFAERLAKDRTSELEQSNRALERAHSKMKRMALYDPLTGLANRRLFQEHLHHAVELARREKSAFAIMIIDLDGFKDVNDTLGHHAGDQVLCEVGRRLQDALRGADLVARLGGDEFAVLVEGAAGAEGAAASAIRIGAAVLAPISIQGQRITVMASIGIAAFPEHADDDVSLIHNADAAMYLAKKNKKLFVTYAPKEADALALTG